MTVSIIHKSASSFTDTTLPKLVRDPRLNNGSQFRLDFTNSFTLNGLGAGAAVADNSVLKNLVDGSFDATATGVSSVAVAAGLKGLANPAASTNSATYLGFPAGSFDMHDAGDHSYIVHVWMTENGSGQLANSNVLVERSGTTNSADVASPIWGASPAPFSMSLGSDGLTLGALARAFGAANTLATPSGSAVGAATLFSFAWTPAACYLFKNGVQVVTGASPGPTVPSTRSHATATVTSNPAAGDTITVNGAAITFVASAPGANQVLIGANAAATQANLMAFINGASASLTARSEVTTGQASNVLTVLRQDSGLLTLTTTSSAITLSSITNAYAPRIYPRGWAGSLYCVAMDDLTVAGLLPAAAALAEYNSYRATLTALGIT